MSTFSVICFVVFVWFPGSLHAYVIMWPALQWPVKRVNLILVQAGDKIKAAFFSVSPTSLISSLNVSQGRFVVLMEYSHT